MNKSNFDLPIDQIFQDLDNNPIRNPESATKRRALFLQQVAMARNRETTTKKRLHSTRQVSMQPSLLRTVLLTLLVIVIVLGGPATTVYASQASLPGQMIYPIKTFSEDTLVALTVSPQSRVTYEMDFVNRRISEMGNLVITGLNIPEDVNDRLQSELDAILQDVAGMSDAMMLNELPNLRLRAEAQLQIVDGMFPQASESDLPIILKVQSRLREQISLCKMGESYPMVSECRYSSAFNTGMVQRTKGR